MTGRPIGGRVSIVGNTGSGKSWLSAQLEERFGLPRLELDGVYHQPDWQPLPSGELRARVTVFVETHDRWVIDGNYSAVQDLVWERAETVVWLDPPRRQAMVQPWLRTVRRAVQREELWNGNREPLSNF